MSARFSFGSIIHMLFPSLSPFFSFLLFRFFFLNFFDSTCFLLFYFSSPLILPILRLILPPCSSPFESFTCQKHGGYNILRIGAGPDVSELAGHFGGLLAADVPGELIS